MFLWDDLLVRVGVLYEYQILILCQAGAHLESPVLLNLGAIASRMAGFLVRLWHEETRDAPWNSASSSAQHQLSQYLWAGTVSHDLFFYLFVSHFTAVHRNISRNQGTLFILLT